MIVHIIYLLLEIVRECLILFCLVYLIDVSVIRLLKLKNFLLVGFLLIHIVVLRLNNRFFYLLFVEYSRGFLVFVQGFRLWKVSLKDSGFLLVSFILLFFSNQFCFILLILIQKMRKIYFESHYFNPASYQKILFLS